ncbi:hypothetical protein [Lentimonas sp. CC19]|uniref:hypothetical protein n=1 Tax=Lentimonas sp. CC19 TaxID=2676097 RepID=UPI00138981AA|nr:hypothetical protein [Lentimonas sp. CC19]
MHLINGIRINRKIFWQCMTVLGGSLCVAILLVVVSMRAQSQEDLMSRAELSQHLEATKAVAPVFVDEEVVVLSPFESALRRHLQATGLSDVESLAFDGTYHAGGVDFKLSILSKRPGLFRQTMEYKKLMIMAGFDGQRYWQDNPLSKQGGTQISPTERLNADLVRLQCSPGIVVWLYEASGGAGLSLLEEVEHAGVSCHVIQNERLLDQPVLHYIAVDSGLELRREVVLKSAGKSFPTRIEYTYSEQAKARVPVVADHYEIFFAGARLAVVAIDSMRVNKGVMPWMFEAE